MSALSRALQAYQKMLDSLSIDVDELDAATPHGSYRLDWLQTSWETLIEGAVSMHPDYGMQKVFLQVYGEGADYYGSSSRILEPEATPTHHLCCWPKQGEAVEDKLSENQVECPAEGFFFDEFVSWDGAWFHRQPSFDHVLIRADESEVVVACEELRFSLYKLPND